MIRGSQMFVLLARSTMVGEDCITPNQNLRMPAYLSTGLIVHDALQLM